MKKEYSYVARNLRLKIYSINPCISVTLKRLLPSAERVTMNIFMGLRWELNGSVWCQDEHLNRYEWVMMMKQLRVRQGVKKSGWNFRQFLIMYSRKDNYPWTFLKSDVVCQINVLPKIPWHSEHEHIQTHIFHKTVNNCLRRCETDRFGFPNLKLLQRHSGILSDLR